MRGAGLVIGVSLGVDGDPARPDAALDRRVLIGAAGLDGNVLKIRPPLCFAIEHADRLIGALAEALPA